MEQKHNPGCDHKLKNGLSSWSTLSHMSSNFAAPNLEENVSVCYQCGEIRVSGRNKDNKFFEMDFDIHHPEAVAAIIAYCNYINEDSPNYAPFVRHRTTTQSPAKAEREGQWYELKEKERGSGEWQFIAAINGPAWKPKGPDIQPVDDRRFYIWIPGSTSTPEMMQEAQAGVLRPIKPLGDWLLAQKDLPPVMLPDGEYWYYGSVLQLLKRYLKESTTPPVKEVEPDWEAWGKGDNQSFYNDWCKETKRSGGILIGSSIRELLQDFAAKLSIAPPVKEAGQPAPSGLRWIQASDRPPDKTGAYFCIDTKYNRKKVGYFTAGRLGRNSLFKTRPKDIKWLDETDSPAPVQVDPELIEAYKEYVKLLGEEIDSMFSLAHIHGWRSERHEKGIELRYKIQSLLPKP